MKCDNPNCDYSTNEVDNSKLEEWIGRPCPKCGENLLTQEDYENAKHVLDGLDFVNSLNPEQLKQFNNFMGKILPTDIPEVPANARIHVETHKGIKMTIVPGDGDNP